VIFVETTLPIRSKKPPTAKTFFFSAHEDDRESGEKKRDLVLFLDVNGTVAPLMERFRFSIIAFWWWPIEPFTPRMRR